MSALPAIMDLKIDIRIFGRKKVKSLNKRFQFENPVGDKFEIPSHCKKLHPAVKKQFQCCSATYEEVLDFRSKLYRSVEKRDQEDFLMQFVKLAQPKYSKDNPNQHKVRMMTITYYHQKATGKKIPICKQMFKAITGMSEKKTETIFHKYYRKQLLNEVNTELQNDSCNRKVQEMLHAKKARLLSLEGGNYTSFVKAVTGTSETNEHPDPVQVEINVKKKKSNPKLRKSKRKQEVEESELEIPDDIDETIFETEQEFNQRVLIDLKGLEICRICLQNHENLLSLFEEYPEKTPAALIKYSLGSVVQPNDGSPQKICTNCLVQVENSCKLKQNFLESQRIMKKSSLEQEKYELSDTVDVLNHYIKLIEAELPHSTDTDSIMVEEYLEQNQEELPEPEQMEIDFSTEPAQQPKRNQRKFYADPSMRPLKCYLCDLEFETTPEEHFTTAHPLIESLRCTKCEFEVEYPWFMNLHYQVHLDSYKICPYCGRRFESNEKEKFQGHRQWCENVGKQKKKEKLYCSKCNVTTHNKSHLKEHIRKFHTKETPYNCTECDMKFSIKMDMRRHMLKHGIGAKCFCPKCGKGYLQNYELVRHQNYCMKVN